MCSIPLSILVDGLTPSSSLSFLCQRFNSWRQLCRWHLTRVELELFQLKTQIVHVESSWMVISLWSSFYKVSPNNFSSEAQKFKAVLQMSGKLTSCLVDFLYCPIAICEKTSQEHIVDKHVVNWIMLQIIGCAVKWRDSTDNIWKKAWRILLCLVMAVSHHTAACKIQGRGNSFGASWMQIYARK